MKTNLVSVVVPIYNVQPYLEKCIETIINQTYKNLEIILVDDGSTDNSGKIADEYAKKDERIIIIHKKNGGLSDARNAGMKIANGDYICFIDSDDYVELDMIEQAINMITAQKLDVVIWGFYIDYEDNYGKLIKRDKKVLNRKVVKINKINDEIELNLNFLNHLGYAWNKLYDLQFLKEYKFEFEKGLSLIEDGEFNRRIFQKVKKFGIIDKAFNHYMQRNRETLGNKKYDNVLELNIKIGRNTREMLQAWDLNENIVEEICLKQWLFIFKAVMKDIITDCNLNKKEKIEKIDNVLAIPEIKKVINCKRIQSKKDKIFIWGIRKHYIFLMQSYYKYFRN